MKRQVDRASTDAVLTTAALPLLALATTVLSRSVARPVAAICAAGNDMATGILRTAHDLRLPCRVMCW